MKKSECDVIIPIYNAYEDLKLCFESLIENTMDVDYRVILVNDKSTDERIEEYLTEIEKKNYEQVTIIRNEKNMGFVKTVNVGMKNSTNDVLLLNSDTILTRNWLRKMINCAYSDDMIATVTPFTTKGVLCSVPVAFIDNELPDGYTIESFNEFIEKISLKQYPEITTAVGFCMYIKRKVLDEIGLFDEARFEKGYCEENDFSLRAFEHGYKNALADDTFVYHKGTMSFNNEDKIRLSTINLEKLHKLHPYYVLNKADNLENNIYRTTTENIKELHHFYKKDVKNILYLMHSDFDEVKSGTELHMLDMLNNNCNSLVLVSNSNVLTLKVYLNGEKINTHHYRLSKPLKNYTLTDKRYREIVESIIESYNIELIHVEHFINHTFDVIDIADEKNIPTFITIHDFYMLCPNYKLLNENKEYCGIKGNKNCESCISKTTNLNYELLKRFKAKCNEVLNKVDRIFVPSKFLKEIFENEYNLNNIQMIEHGIRNNKIEYTPEYSKLRVAFVGHVTIEKGSDLIYNIITSNKTQDIEFYLIGYIEDEKIRKLNKKNIHKLGEYNRNELSNILINNKINISCMLSIVPESYSYTLSEVLACHIPVVVSNLGALKSRVSKLKAGEIVENLDSDNVIKIFDKIATNKEYRNELVVAAQNAEIESIQNMINKYIKEYKKYYNSKSITNKEEYVRKALFVSKEYSLDNTNSTKIQELESRINLMENSLWWRSRNKLEREYGSIFKLGKKVFRKLHKLKK